MVHQGSGQLKACEGAGNNFGAGAVGAVCCAAPGGNAVECSSDHSGDQGRALALELNKNGTITPAQYEGIKFSTRPQLPQNATSDTGARQDATGETGTRQDAIGSTGPSKCS